jgi:hypothetical protein
LEAFAGTRVRLQGKREERVTANLVTACFRHETSRELDPHLHTHCVIRGDLTMFSLADQTRQMVEADLGKLEIEAPDAFTPAGSATRLGKKLDAMRRAEAGAGVAQSKASDLEAFVRDNSEILKQVAGSTHETLVMWVMLYLMHAAKARERGHRVASEFVRQNPELQARIRAMVSNEAKPHQSEKMRPRQSPKLRP